MSLYIRLKYANKFGMVSCYTCDKPIEWRAREPLGADNGHFITRDRNATRYDENNCRPQCGYCNKHLKGNQAIFAERLNKEYGYDVASELRAKSKKLTPLSVQVLRIIAKTYREKFKTLPNYYLYKQ